MNAKIKDFFRNLWVRKLAVIGYLLMYGVPLGIVVYFGFKSENTNKIEIWAFVIALIVLGALVKAGKEWASRLAYQYKIFISGTKYILTILIFYWIMKAISAIFTNGLDFMLYTIYTIAIGLFLVLLDYFINSEYILDREITVEAKREVLKKRKITELENNS